jgi:hypothetical protein
MEIRPPYSYPAAILQVDELRSRVLLARLRARRFVIAPNSMPARPNRNLKNAAACRSKRLTMTKKRAPFLGARASDERYLYVRDRSAVPLAWMADDWNLLTGMSSFWQHHNASSRSGQDIRLTRTTRHGKKEKTTNHVVTCFLSLCEISVMPYIMRANVASRPSLSPVLAPRIN